MKTAGSYYVVVIEDINSGKVIACATLVVEQKFIHNCSLVCNYLLYSPSEARIVYNLIWMYLFTARTFGRCSSKQ